MNPWDILTRFACTLLILGAIAAAGAQIAKAVEKVPSFCTPARGR